MHPKRKQRLMVALAIVVLSSATIASSHTRSAATLIFSTRLPRLPRAKRQSIANFEWAAWLSRKCERASDRLETRFEVTDFVHSVTVTYDGILPDLLQRERVLSLRCPRCRWCGYRE